jgi:cobaltochelatase CobS
MAHLDDELQKSLRAAHDKLAARERKSAPKDHKKTELVSITYEEGTRPFSDVFGFVPPSGMDHAVPSFSVDSWHEDVQRYIPEVDFDYVLPPTETEEAVVAVIQNKPLLITGKKGSGKTTLQQQICARLCIPWFRVNCRRDMESSSFFGTPDLTAGNLGWIDGPVPLFGTHGGMVTMDEVSATPSGISLALQSPLERKSNGTGGPIYIPEKPKGERYMHPHKWFRLGATDNTQLQGDTTGRYAGTNVQNEALIDRFLTSIKLDYLSREHETAVIKSRVSRIPEDWLSRMLDVADLVRRAYDSGNLNMTISPRGLISWAEDAVYWGDLARSFRLSFANKLIEDDLKQVVEIFLKATAIDLNKV